MNPIILAQVTAAQRQYETDRNHDERMPESATRIEFGRGQIKATISGDGDFVEATIVDSRPVEGPKLGQANQSPGRVLPPNDPRYAGKAGR